jgi:hypothetical protein
MFSDNPIWSGSIDLKKNHEYQCVEIYRIMKGGNMTPAFCGAITFWFALFSNAGMFWRAQVAR